MSSTMTSTIPQGLGTPLLLEEYFPISQPLTPTSPPLCAVCHTQLCQHCGTCKTIHYCGPICHPLLLEEYFPISQPLTPTSPPLCAVCHTQLCQHCGTCKTIHYCGPICQTSDWPLHHLLCKNSITTSRPNPNDRRALYLPAETAKPRFVWLRYGDSGIPLNRAQYFPTTPNTDLYTIGFHNRYLPYWLQITYDKNLSSRALQANKTVSNLLGPAMGGAEMEWRGPLLVIAYSAEEGLSEPALDVGVEVLGPLCGYLRLRREYGGLVFVEQPQERYGEEEWRGIVGGMRKGGEGVEMGGLEALNVDG